MRPGRYKMTMGALLATGVLVAGAAQAATFAPVEEWKAAVLAGSKAALARLYSTNPPAVLQLENAKIDNPEAEWSFWSALGAAGISGVNAKVLDVSEAGGVTRVLLRIEAVENGKPVVMSMGQAWGQLPGGWRLLATQRTTFHPAVTRTLPEPAKPNSSLYPPPGEARAELKTAEGEAAKEGKRVLAVFGANWCYDCHVLDTTFRSAAFAPLVNGNYVVIHINIGEEGKDNNDLARELGVNLDKGIPSLAVLEPGGKVVVAQKGGEFESTVKIGPGDVRDFLEKWKPGR